MKRRSRIPGIHRAFVLLPAIDDDASEAHKNALAAKNVCATEGRCPACGAVGKTYRDASVAAVLHLIFEHEAWCAVLADEDTP